MHNLHLYPIQELQLVTQDNARYCFLVLYINLFEHVLFQNNFRNQCGGERLRNSCAWDIWETDGYLFEIGRKEMEIALDFKKINFFFLIMNVLTIDGWICCWQEFSVYIYVDRKFGSKKMKRCVLYTPL